MGGHARLGGAIIVTAGIGLAAALAAPGVAAPTVKGDTAAWAEITAAFKKLYALPGFRAKTTTADGTTMVAEFASTNLHWTVQSAQGTFEVFVVGNEEAHRFTLPGAPGGAQCQRSPRRTEPPIMDPSTFTGEYTVGRKPDTVIDGTPVRAFTYTQAPAGGGSGTEGDVYVGAQTGLPRRLTIADSASQGKTNTIDLYDYGAKISIVLPC